MHRLFNTDHNTRMVAYGALTCQIKAASFLCLLMLSYTTMLLAHSLRCCTNWLVRPHRPSTPIQECALTTYKCISNHLLTVTFIEFAHKKIFSYPHTHLHLVTWLLPFPTHTLIVVAIIRTHCHMHAQSPCKPCTLWLLSFFLSNCTISSSRTKQEPSQHFTVT